MIDRIKGIRNSKLLWPPAIAVFLAIGATILQAAADSEIRWVGGLLRTYFLPVMLTFTATSLAAWGLWHHKKRVYKLTRATTELEETIEKLGEKIKELEGDISDFRSGLAKKQEKFDRFEDIAAQGVTWAFVEFWPTATYDQNTEQVTGLGVDIFHALFDTITTRHAEDIITWENMLDKLDDGVFDVLVTPLYEIRDRKNVAFCLPLFYSDIGLFARTDDPLLHHPSTSLPMSYSELEKWGAGLESVAIEFIPGELHHKLSTKIFGKALLEEAPRDCTPARLLKRLRSDDCPSHRLQFIERWQGERAQGGSELMNILQPEELLFPVSFVVRREDDTLRRFINLRLMELADDEGGQGIHRLLRNSCDSLKLFEKASDEEDMKRLTEYFRRTVPIKLHPTTRKDLGHPPTPQNLGRKLDFPKSAK